MSDKIKNIFISVVFLLFLFMFLLINLLSGDKEISISERRKLQQFPKITMNNLFNGTFFKDLDSYVADQFVARDIFRKIKIKLDLIMKKNYNNLYNYDDFIIKQEFPLNKESVINLANRMSLLKSNYFRDNNVYFTIVPDKNYFVDDGNLRIDYNELENVMKEKLVDFNYIDIFDLLELEDYYKTDSHWKQENIVPVAKRLANRMNSDINENYTVKEVTTFKGVYSGQMSINNKVDTIKILTNDIIDTSVVYNYENGKKSAVYDLNKLSSFDKYDIYLSGAVPIIDIITNNSEGKQLVVFRDSYGSCLIPLLLEKYSKITVIDTRYVSSKILGNYVDFENKDILFIYGVLTINNSYSIK